MYPSKEYATLTIVDLHSSIVPPTMDANSFELKPSLLSMVQEN